MKNIVITGASTGIGRATALMLDKEGFRVFAGVRKESDGESLKAHASPSLVPVILDVTDEASIGSAVETVAAEVGDEGIFGLVNNAGITLTEPLEYADMAGTRYMFDVNVFGVLSAIQQFLPLLRRGQGRIINVSSGAGRLATPLVGAYSGTKFAVEGMSDVLRVELRQWGIRVIVVEPGFIKTEIHNKMALEKSLSMLDEEGKARYGRSLKRYFSNSEGLIRNAPDGDLVARVMLKALTAKSPRARYAAGKDAVAGSLLARVLPDKWKDALFARIMGL